MNELARQFIDLPVEFSTDKDPLTRAAGIMACIDRGEGGLSAPS